jgi:hypothetical protein
VIREFRAAAVSIIRGGSPGIDHGISAFVRNVFDLEAALQMGFTVTLSDVTPIEFRALLVLREERARHQEWERRMEEAKSKSRQVGGF